MPVYEYRCDKGHTFEVTQRMSDDPVTSCAACESPVQRVFHPVAVHFKGSGFYTTDYGRKKTAGGGSSDDTTGSKKDDGGGKGEKPGAGKSDSGSSSSSGD